MRGFDRSIAVVSPVPIGPPLVWVPAGLWLIQTGHMGWGVFVLAWGMFAVSTIDNVIKPLIISRGVDLPFVLVLLGVLGGVIAFGFIGVFLGPVLLAVGYALLIEWAAMRGGIAATETLAPPDPGDVVAPPDPGAVVMPEHLAPEIASARRPRRDTPLGTREVRVPTDQPYHATMEYVERVLITQALDRCNGNIERAAQLLGLSRKGLFLKRQRLGLR